MDLPIDTFASALAAPQAILTSVTATVQSIVQFIGTCTDYVSCSLDKAPLFSPLAWFIERLFDGPPEPCTFNWSA
jgi:hypothetical protein